MQGKPAKETQTVQAIIEDENKSIALLIDGENISPVYFNQIREDLAKRGTISIFRIYADWTAENLPRGWKEDVLSIYPFVAIQQFSLSSGKNSIDNALIIDAMDLIYQKGAEIDYIALVSSDSDFTRLALNLREKKFIVLGYGESKTPPTLRNACHEFIILEKSKGTKTNRPKVSENTEVNPIPEVVKDAVRELIAQGQDEFCNLGAVSLYLRRIKSDFNLQKDLGVNKLSEFFKKHHSEYELKMPRGPGTVYVRIKA